MRISDWSSDVCSSDLKVTAALRSVARSGVAFRNISTLADYLAPVVGRSASRLRRNRAYRAMLEAHLSRQRGAASIITARDRDMNTLKAKLRVAELEICSLTRDKNRLSAVIEKHLPGIDGKNQAVLSEAKSSTAVSADYRVAFESTAQVLAALLERVEPFGYEV